MTEAKWLATNNTTEALRYLCGQAAVTRSKAGRRKLRLFACACWPPGLGRGPGGRLPAGSGCRGTMGRGLAEEAEVGVREQCSPPRNVPSWPRWPPA